MQKQLNDDDGDGFYVDDDGDGDDGEGDNGDDDDGDDSNSPNIAKYSLSGEATSSM